MKGMIARELTAEQYDWLWNNEETAPKTEVSTGLDGSQGATDLQIYRQHVKGRIKTIVVPCGEYQNAEPWVFNSDVAPGFVLREYLKVMKEAS